MFVEMALFHAVPCTVGFIHGFQKLIANIMTNWVMSESPAVGQAAVACLKVC